MNLDLLSIKEKLEPFVKAAGDRALSEWDNIQINLHEDEVDVTSEIEKEIEKDFSKFVLKNFPEFGFQGEELPELNREGEYKFLIDPIDGSKYYAKGVAFWTVTIALVKGEQPLLGLIYMPTTKQLFWAGKDLGAYLNDKRLGLTEETNLDKLQIGLDMSLTGKEVPNSAFELMKDIFSCAYRVRMPGVGSISLLWLCQGFFGGYIKIFPKSKAQKSYVDTIAGMRLALEAGGVVAEFAKYDLILVIVGRKEVVDMLESKLLI